MIAAERRRRLYFMLDKIMFGLLCGFGEAVSVASRVCSWAYRSRFLLEIVIGRCVLQIKLLLTVRTKATSLSHRSKGNYAAIWSRNHRCQGHLRSVLPTFPVLSTYCRKLVPLGSYFPLRILFSTWFRVRMKTHGTSPMREETGE